MQLWSNEAFSPSTAPDAAKQCGLITVGEALGFGDLGSNPDSQSVTLRLWCLIKLCQALASSPVK